MTSPHDPARVRVVLFSGGRGSGALVKQLVQHPHVHLTIAINGYDDGASTGEVRRFLGDSLGPSDFRKNASRLATELKTCPAPLVEMLDARLPNGLSREAAIDTIRQRAGVHPAAADRVARFVEELERTGKAFNFDDCSVGNLVFAGSFLSCGRDFNRAIDDYCTLLGLPVALVENVTDGVDAHLVALGEEGTLLGSEEEIVGAVGKNRIRDIYLIARALDPADRATLASAGTQQAAAFFDRHAATVRLNPRLAPVIAAADLIIYAPGTQHSSLFPSYLTPGLSAAIAHNLRAIKLLVTNIQTDAEIEGSSAVDIISRALYYLNEKGRRSLPTPCLITHYLVNDPGHVETSAPYVPLGQIDTLEDPRLVRVANFEEGVTGRHDASKILAPFLRSLAERGTRQRLAVVFPQAASINKITQTLLEMVRGGVADVPIDIAVAYEGAPLDHDLEAALPFAVRALDRATLATHVLDESRYDYVLLFESSGMYRGEDIAVLASHLAPGRLDAAWGSRRLSVRDIEASIKFRYQRSPIFGTISAFGSHVLSLACLLFYGRYISDTLSGVRAARTADIKTLRLALDDDRLNQPLLGRLLRRKAEILEIPVQFLPISPDRVRRTGVVDGLRALGALMAARFRAREADSSRLPAPAEGDKRSPNPAVSR